MMVSPICNEVQLENRKQRESWYVLLWKASMRHRSATLVLWSSWTTHTWDKHRDGHNLLPHLPPGAYSQDSRTTQEHAPEPGFYSPKFSKKTPTDGVTWRCWDVQRRGYILSLQPQRQQPLGKAWGRNSFISLTWIWCLTLYHTLLEQRSQHWAVSNNWVLP